MMTLSTMTEFSKKTKQTVSISKRKRKLHGQKERNGSYQPTLDSCSSAPHQPCARSPAHRHAPSRADPSLLGGVQSPPLDLKRQSLVIKMHHTVDYNCSKHPTYLSSHNPYRLVADSDPASALPEPPSRPPPSRPPIEGDQPLRSGPYFRRLCLQFGRITFFGTSSSSLRPERNIHIVP